MNQQIADYRKERGMTQGEFAELVGVKQATIGMVESGNRAISKNLAIKLHLMDPDNFSLIRLLCPDCKAA